MKIKIKAFTTCRRRISWFLIFFFYYFLGNNGLSLDLTQENKSSTPSCLECHTDAYKIPQSQFRIDPDTYSNSSHGHFSCSECHTEIKDASVIPHLSSKEKNLCRRCHVEYEDEFKLSQHNREFNKKAPLCQHCHGSHQILASEESESCVNKKYLAQTCAACHKDRNLYEDPDLQTEDVISLYASSIHHSAIGQGNLKAASCCDCHSHHTVLSAAEVNSPTNRQNIPVTCGACHSEEYEKYIKSIHGKGFQKGLANHPVCTDCHGSHKILPVRQEKTRLTTEQNCQNCHNRQDFLERYGQTVNPCQTYQESYHSLAAQSGKANAATCSDCHNAHFIIPKNNPLSTVHPDHIVKTCSKCHPEATEKFATSYTHKSIDTQQNKIKYWVRFLYLRLITFIVGLILLHNLILFLKCIKNKYQTERQVVAPQANQASYKRFSRAARIQHTLLLISFLVLLITGMALKFPEAFWVIWLQNIGFSETLRRSIHRIFAVLLISTALYHLIWIRINPEARHSFKAIKPNWYDFKAVFWNLAYHLGIRTKPPEFGKFNYMQKFEYWSVLWGTIIMVITGLILWFPALVLRMKILPNLPALLPSWIIVFSETVHYYEAWLALLVILVHHLFHTLFCPTVYPLDLSIFTGRITKEELNKKYPLWSKEISTKDKNKDPF